MARFYILLFLAQLPALAVARVYTGFNYGAFWHPSQAKFKKDFVHEFNLAKALPNTPVPFDSARLFTCIQWFTKDEPIEAFDAAIETNTSLLLGFWAQNETMLDVELVSLAKAFEKHGSKLSDLVVGLSIGNEDIYRFEHPETSQGLQGASEDQIKSLVQLTREKINKSSFAAFMIDTPIGHTDIQDYVPSGMDFIGVNNYPCYSHRPIEKANKSFFDTLANVRKKANDNTPVWITETGWPFSDHGGKSMATAVASAENMQKYWTEVGCFFVWSVQHLVVSAT
jgi:glucan endo-1,3-beta-D-glucosidase